MIWLEAIPYALLVLSGIGFILALIADGWTHERRMKIGILMIVMACVSVAVMK